MDAHKGAAGGGGGSEVRRINVVYFLSRGGRTDHPHLFRVNHLNRAGGVHLRGTCQEVALRAARQGHAGQLLLVLQKEVQGRVRVAGPEGRRPHHARLRQRVRAQGLRRPGNTSSLRPSAKKDFFHRREETQGGRGRGDAVQRRSEPPRGGGTDAGLRRELPEAAAAACGPGLARRLRVGAAQHGPVQGREAAGPRQGKAAGASGDQDRGVEVTEPPAAKTAGGRRRRRSGDREGRQQGCGGGAAAGRGSGGGRQGPRGARCWEAGAEDARGAGAPQHADVRARRRRRRRAPPPGGAAAGRRRRRLAAAAHADVPRHGRLRPTREPEGDEAAEGRQQGQAAQARRGEEARRKQAGHPAALLAVREGVQAAGAALAHAVVPGLQGADEEQHQRPPQRRQEAQLADRRPLLLGAGAAVLSIRRVPAHGILTRSSTELIALLADLENELNTLMLRNGMYIVCVRIE